MPEQSIFDEFLDEMARAGAELAAQSDILRLTRLPVPHVGIFLAEFDLPYLARRPGGGLEVAAGPLGVVIHFGTDYLRRASPLEVVQVREMDIWHPNVRWPVLCVGDVQAGMALPFLLRHVYEVLTYQNFALDDALEPEAACRLREDPALLDLLPPPPRLVRRRLDLEVVGEGGGSHG